MSFALKGGYNAFYRKIINVSLKKTTVWNRGAVIINGVRCNIDSARDNEIEIIKYNDMNTLLVNDAIIYENQRLFTYDINLNYNFQYKTDFSKKNIYSYIDFKAVNYNDLEHLFSTHCLK